jgi:dienelactone hydrolase
VIKQQGDAGLDRTMPFGWETGRHVVHNSYIWITGIEHSTEHFGQLVVYYRANNLVPPESRLDQAQRMQQPSAPRVVELKVSDGTVLKASYFAAVKPGPGVLLLHQSNRTRDSWDGVARQLAAAGINTLTLDMRGFGESGGTPSAKLTDTERAKVRAMRPSDVDTAFQYLISQPGVKGDVIGVGGAGEFGVGSSVGVARRHSAKVKSLALLSGETLQDGLQFLRQASQLPGLFVVADDDEYPPTVEAMELLYITASSPGKKFVHYSAAQDAPWIWYETSDAGKVPANGGHGTDMFRVHPELPGIIVDWFVTTLIKTPGHAPADSVASAAILDQIRMPGGVAQVTQQLMEARRRDPEAQLFPEITVSIIGQDHLRAGEPKLAVEVLKLDLLAYPESADAHETLAEAYLADGQKDLARQHAEKALAILDSHTVPASSWTDTEQYRGEIRNGAQDVLKKLSAVH